VSVEIGVLKGEKGAVVKLRVMIGVSGVVERDEALLLFCFP
jgi:hypothetical protein